MCNEGLGLLAKSISGFEMPSLLKRDAIEQTSRSGLTIARERVERGEDLIGPLYAQKLIRQATPMPNPCQAQPDLQSIKVVSELVSPYDEIPFKKLLRTSLCCIGQVNQLSLKPSIFSRNKLQITCIQ